MHEDRLQGSNTLAEGNEALTKSQYQAAAEAFTKAIDFGELPVDSYCEALAKRAIAYAHLKQFERALADVDVLAQGAPDLASTHAVRSFIFRKQGKLPEAAKELAIARRHNPNVKVIRD